ncbi:MAG: cytoplasmic protein [Elusimicrobia bacterium GWF2_52_66]|nr:MAG: cytoplasmic protein [Elusimicrobia bacterium GWA2_51_34]OGR86887.1 MAG: cytoplasmic protein [Elusimicrobia bacterium GWF2_52_66]HAF95676.1 cytoplasmic protein [Elusimicrobiota bacterium]HCE97417.1 cytoplasmic protein [Elusimicrobiota bacterium]
MIIKKPAKSFGQGTTGHDFSVLIQDLRNLHDHLKYQTVKAVNTNLTLRNWLFGCRIKKYELKGRDRAKYGEGLFAALAEKLTGQGIPNCAQWQLYLYRNFYLAFPEIFGTLSQKLQSMLPDEPQTSVKSGALFPKSDFLPDKLLNDLSYSHFEELTKVEPGLKRNFYVAECIRGNWSVRELKRQIASLYYERASLSKNKAKLSNITHAKAETLSAEQIIRDPYVFEFLGAKPREVMAESDMEDALLTKLQDFLLELGRGFCFEARQKRILIGGEHYFVDLVFYHRILKCHVLIELKTESFKHEHIGQLNTYVNWYRKNETAKGDNPPIGILLCTRRNRALIEYALAGINNRLFISKYQLELPGKDEIQAFLNKQICKGGLKRIVH